MESGRASRHRLTRALGNFLGAAVALIAVRANARFFLDTHRLIGVVFAVQQAWVAIAFVVRRPARTVSHRARHWAFAYGGTFGPFLLRPSGYHPALGVPFGLSVQIASLASWAFAFMVLGRSFGLVAADRGLVTRGPYRIVRHPLYTSYLLGMVGYLLQSVSAWNVVVLLFVLACQVFRILAEEQHLAGVPAYAEYRTAVPWRAVPGVW